MMCTPTPDRDVATRRAEEDEEAFTGSFSKKTPPKKTAVSRRWNHYTFKSVLAQIILLATATSRFKGLDDAREPFFELFRILRLEPLDAGECRRLWRAVSGDEVGGRAIRPLEILTGGNPRLLVIVAEFACHRSLRRLMEELVTLIDDHTEYFRAHLQGLAKTERRVYLAVIDLWQASSTGEVANRARMDVRPVSTLLGRLVDRGAVVVEGSGRKRRYAAAERLYSIYCWRLRRSADKWWTSVRSCNDQRRR